MQKIPHLLIEGMIIAAYAAGANRAFIFIRGEYVQQADILDAALGRGLRRRPARREHPRHRPLAVARRAPRRGRLHLRRGDRPARLARGQARQPAPQAAVPRQPGPLPGPDADQQRRDAGDRAADRRDGRRGVREDRRRGLHRHEARLDLGQRPAPGQLRDRARDVRRATSSTAWPAAPTRAARSSCGSRAARRRRCSPPTTSTSPTTSTRWPRPGRCSARARSSSSTTPTRSSTSALMAGRVLPPRVVRQVHAVPRGHQLDREDARAHPVRPGHADGPRHHGLGPGADHRQLPVRARRRDGDARRLDDRQVPRRVRGLHRGRARRQPVTGGDEPAPELALLQGAVA